MCTGEQGAVHAHVYKLWHAKTGLTYFTCLECVQQRLPSASFAQTWYKGANLACSRPTRLQTVLA